MKRIRAFVEYENAREIWLKLTAVLSKAFLLAEDAKINDPAIVSQIRPNT